MACTSGCIFTLVAFFRFFSIVRFQALAWQDAWSHWLHLFDLSPCVFKYLHNELGPVHAKLHWLNLCDFSPCIFKCVLTALVSEQAYLHFQMCPKIAVLRRGKTTLLAFRNSGTPETPLQTPPENPQPPSKQPSDTPQLLISLEQTCVPNLMCTPFHFKCLLS